jgi:hypothetical protein
VTAKDHGGSVTTLNGGSMGKHAALLLFFLCFIAILLIQALPVMSSFGSTETRYEVVAKGFCVGNVITSQKSADEGGEKVVHFENRTDVNASFLWMGYRFSSSERATIKRGTLVSYFRHKKEKDVEVKVEGRLVGATFRFEVSENGNRRIVTIPRSSYDLTTMECPEATMDFGANGKATLRILDTEYMSVVKRNYQLVREDVYRISGREYRCRIVDFTDPNKTCRRWIGKDGDAIIMFRQDGKGGEGAYSVRATVVDRPG